MFCLQVGVAHAKYKNCGHKKSLTPEQATQVVDFVKHWRAKVFCSCRHVRAELKLKVSLTTISRTLNRHISFSFLCFIFSYCMYLRKKLINQAPLLLEGSPQEASPHRCPEEEEEGVCGRVLSNLSKNFDLPLLFSFGWVLLFIMTFRVWRLQFSVVGRQHGFGD